MTYSEEIEVSWFFRKYSLEKKNSRESFQKLVYLLKDSQVEQQKKFCPADPCLHAACLYMNLEGMPMAHIDGEQKKTEKDFSEAI